MSHHDKGASSGPGRGALGEYEAPRVERVLTPAELEREILYAGQDDQTGDPK